MRKLLNLPIAFLFVFSGVAAVNAQSPVKQTALAAVTASNSAAGSRTIPQNVVTALSSLPEADALVYVNPQRILTEVAPKFLSPKDLEGMRRGFEEAKKNAGIDPQRVEYLVIALRFNKPSADLQFRAPEFLVVSGGDFSAESLMALARIASQGKLREEKHGDKTIGLMTIDPLVKEAEKNPFLRSFTEMAVAPLNANSIAAGSPGYLRAALDASSGTNRISVDALQSLIRDPNALISVAGSPWNSFAKSFGMLGTEGNPRAPRCESKIGNFYAALTMDATNFSLRGAMNEDNPDTAKIISNLLGMFLKGATGSMKDPGVQTLLKSIAINAEGDEVMLRADVPQQMVLDMVKKQMQPKMDTPASSTKPAAKPATTKRRTRRRS